MPGLNRVLYTIDQRNDTTDAEKATARANIGAQGALTAGANITISEGVISAANTEYQAGHGLTLSNNTFAVDDSQLQTKLAAGSNIQINGNTISATDTKYTAGTNVQISQDNVISATDTKYTAGTNVQINSSNVISATDTKYTAGSNVQIDANNVISATDTKYTAGSGLSLSGTTFSNTAPNVKSDWNAAAGSSSEILNKPTVPSIKTTSTTLPPVDTNVSNMTLFTDGRVTVNNSTDVGLLAPIGTQSDAGKVLTGTYSGSPGKFTAAWRTVQSPISAGNGITISNNVVSAKVKAGGGIGVDANGLYLAEGVVLVTKNNTFAEIKAIYDAGKTPLLTYTIGSGNNISYCYSLLESYWEAGGVKGFDFERVAGTARTVVSHIQDNLGWLPDTVTDLQYELTDGNGVSIDQSTNTISAEVDTDYGLSLAATGVRVKVNSSDALTVNSNGLAVKEGSINYQKMPKNIMLSLIGSDDNEQNSTVTAKRVTLADKTNRRLCFVNLLEAAQVLFMAKDSSADHAHQIIHVDFEANVEPAPSYDNNSTQFSICAVATNMNNPNYVVDPTQEAKFVFGSDFKNNPRKNHITASFNIDPSQMTNTWVTSDPELCIICDATTSSIDTRGLLFSNIRVSGFVFADR